MPVFRHLLSSDCFHSAAWATFGTFKINTTWAWRIPSLLQVIPSVLQVIFILFAPESPRYLVSKGKEAEALETLAYYHADSNEWVCSHTDHKTILTGIFAGMTRSSSTSLRKSRPLLSSTAQVR
jgi:hypothetical protein